MEPSVDIAFDCLPLRSISRLDVPLDASAALRERCERLQEAIEAHGTQNAYYLYNTRCVYRLANSSVANMLRFGFDGTVLTDSGDSKAERAHLAIDLIGETCAPMTPEVLAWFRQVVEQAVLIEFDRFIAAGRLGERVKQLGRIGSIREVADFAGMNV